MLRADAFEREDTLHDSVVTLQTFAAFETPVSCVGPPSSCPTRPLRLLPAVLGKLTSSGSQISAMDRRPLTKDLPC